MISGSVTGKNWIYKKFDNNKVLKICEKFSIKEIISRLLVIRNIKIDDVNLFLEPSIKNSLPEPNTLTDMEKSVNIVTKAISEKKKVGIFGDYDVDGASATALLKKYFKSIKHPCTTYIPDRQKDGYGPTVKTFEYIINEHANLIITVDCGTSSFDAIKFAKNKNVKTIILDHHQANINLPDADAIINPNRLDDKSNLNHLCAAGVAFMFLISLNRSLRKVNWFKKNNITEPNLIEYLDLVALGTVCDVVPLVGVNRVFVKQGLKVIAKRENLGIKTLCDLSKISSKPNTYHIGYILGPKINAGGRVGQSSFGAELLTSDNPSKAFKLASELDKFNKDRQLYEKNLIEEVEKEAIKNIKDPVLVLCGKFWHEGIIGIIASRIKEKFNKPTVLISLKDNTGKGSSRSVLGFDIGSNIIKAVQMGILLKGGGHKMAGGFSILDQNIEKFKKFLIENYLKLNLDTQHLKNLYLDATIYPTALNEDFYNDIDLLSPFGSGNYEPNFVIEDMKLLKGYIVGKKHIKSILLSKSGNAIKTITFNAVGSQLEPYLTLTNKKLFNIAGKLSLNEWKGKKDIEFVINDISVNRYN
ncbi:MAG: single-stranded-DNA-specific exonuclease RecJ [Candidatus Pelagibacter sp. TMED64]|nr:single-stranded-DNA-specific exonuclease RecJ [Candidatus Pelagibacter sp.]OUU64870.1 MAG: single-stranded-DNA-specific exonuclease RecJ [Candidatus Pelagibacter sp. TMED64]|tara:strand:- start:1908 stop:3665 length:1758 start_codon:yes stop_codon:yes gene_type:complete